MSNPAYSELVARALYAAEGHGSTGPVHLVPITGRDAPNVIDLVSARARREEEVRKSHVRHD